MARKAVIIASGNPAGQSPLKGPDIDLDEMNYYLRSKVGGAWLDSEISSLSDPTVAEVIAKLMEVKPNDYAFVYFSGHGSHPVGGTQIDTVVNLYDGPTRVRDLHPACNKALIMVDACRRVSPVATNFNRYITEHAKIAKVRTPPENYRRLFQAALDRIDGLSNYVFSCSVGEFAIETAAVGGIFTRAMISQAFDWESRASGWNRAQGIVQAVLRASNIVGRTSDQNPQWITNRHSERHLPFAVHIT